MAASAVLQVSVTGASDTGSSAAADRSRAVARQQASAGGAAELLASLASSLADSFADRTTIVGALSAAQAGFAADGATPSDRAISSRVAPKAATSFAVTLARASLPASASVTAAKAAANYAETSRSHAAA